MRIKKAFMTYLWRVQQSQAIISIVFWSLTISGIFYQYVAPLFQRWGLVSSKDVALGLSLLFLLTLSIMLAAGFLYDNVLQLWKEQVEVTRERNPYANGKLLPKELNLYRDFHLPLAKAIQKIEPTRELEMAIQKAEGWIETGDTND